MQHALDVALGSSADTMTWSQMTLRAVLIFVYGVVVFRFAYRRFFGQSTDFDIVVAVLIGSAMSRTLTGNAPLLPTLAATTTLMALHGVLALMAWRWPLVGWLIKGAEPGWSTRAGWIAARCCARASPNATCWKPYA